MPQAPQREPSHPRSSRAQALRAAARDRGTGPGQAFYWPAGTHFRPRFLRARRSRFRGDEFLIHRSGVRVPSGVPITNAARTTADSADGTASLRQTGVCVSSAISASTASLDGTMSSATSAGAPCGAVADDLGGTTTLLQSRKVTVEAPPASADDLMPFNP
jgi:hypothetical protein